MAGSRPRLLFLSPLPPPQGGIATWMQAVLRSPLAERFEIEVVNSSPSAVDGVAGTSRLRLDRIGDALGILLRLGAALLRLRPALLHVNTSYFWAFLRDGLAVWLASTLGVRTLLHFRGGDFPEFVQGSRPALRRAIEATLRRADRLIALTRHTEAYLGTIAGASRVRYVPNFVRLADAGEPVDREARSGPVHVLFVGWILEAKGVRELLAAARGIPEARFTLVGPEEPAFADAVRPEIAALGERVRLLPARPRDEIMKLYREADVFVLPTWREGFPNVVLEAMAAGLPVVATTVGAIPDAVRDGVDGLLVPPRDAVALTAALGRLVADRPLRLALGRSAGERVRAEFSLEAVTERLDAVYRELLPRRG